ncbi:hypothetical protein QE375_003343 [Microbacterium foliorum]|uniref:DUF5313 domain-containing protein n=1 Tax=Microbacterium foliorum TaxID=104336 RepID=A0ABU1HWX1_9MICO|nr:hypothetical protein [Microbacterium foliorum]MDR6143789.1 hypothetical protein [Microbacterium foliorum]
MSKLLAPSVLDIDGFDMWKEFGWQYAKHALMIGPVVAIVVFIPPNPISVKLQMFGSFFILLLLVELVSLSVVISNRRKERMQLKRFADHAAVVGSIADTSRKGRRKRAQLEDHHPSKPPGPDD